MTRQKNKRDEGDRKRESNDSPEIPYRGRNIRHPRPPFGSKNGQLTDKGKGHGSVRSRSKVVLKPKN